MEGRQTRRVVLKKLGLGAASRNIYNSQDNGDFDAQEYWGKVTLNNWGYFHKSIGKYHKKTGDKGKNRSVLVIDSGFDTNHPLFNPVYKGRTHKPYYVNVHGKLGEDFYDKIVGADSIHDRNNQKHGTGVLGVVWQFTPNAEFHVANIGKDIWKIDIEGGLDFVHAINEARKSQVDYDVIVTSHGLTDLSWVGKLENLKQKLIDATKRLVNSQTIVIAAAGNSAEGAQYPAVPSTVNGVMSVASTDVGHTLSEPGSPKKPKGKKPDVAAPGENIFTLGDPNTSSEGVEGARWVEPGASSLAAPHVAGIALLLSKYGSATEVRDSILNNTKPIRGDNYLNVKGRASMMAAYNGLTSNNGSSDESVDLRSIECGQTRQGEIDEDDVSYQPCGTDVAGAYYEPVTFSGTADQDVSITMKRLSDYDEWSNLDLRLLNPANEEIATITPPFDDPGRNPVQLSATLEQDGEYTIQAGSHCRPSSETFPYELTLECEQSAEPEEDEPDDVKFVSCTRVEITGTFTEGDLAFASTSFYENGTIGNTLLEDGITFGDDVSAPFSGTVVFKIGEKSTVTERSNEIVVEIPNYGSDGTAITGLTTTRRDYAAGGITHSHPRSDQCLEKIKPQGGASTAFEVSITGTNTPVNAGNFLEVTTTIRNTGNTKIKQNVRLIVGHDPQQVDSQTVTVSPNRSTQVSLGYQTPTVKNTQEFPVRIKVGDRTAQQTVKVYGTQDPGDQGSDDSGDGSSSLSVRITGTNAPVDAGNRLNVTAQLRNPGEQTVSETVTLIVGHSPDQVDSQTVSVPAGGTKTVTLGYKTYPAKQDTSFPVRVKGANSADQQTVTVYGTG